MIGSRKQTLARLAFVVVLIPFLFILTQLVKDHHLHLQKIPTIVSLFFLFLIVFIGETLYTCSKGPISRFLLLHGNLESVKTGEASTATLSVKPTMIKFLKRVIIESPAYGTVLSIKVNVGDKVNSGDVVLVLKKEDLTIEVTSPRNGTIKKINVAEGYHVLPKDLLMTIKL